jgi:hypothetical protein
MASMQATDTLAQKRCALRSINTSLQDILSEYDKLSSLPTDSAVIRHLLDRLAGKLVSSQAIVNNLFDIIQP